MKTIIAITALAAAGLLAACATAEEDSSAFNASTPAPVMADAAPAQHAPSESESAR